MEEEEVCREKTEKREREGVWRQCVQRKRENATSRKEKRDEQAMCSDCEREGSLGRRQTH